MINVFFTDGTSKSIEDAHVSMVPEGSWLLLKFGHKTLMAIPAENVKYVQAD